MLRIMQMALIATCSHHILSNNSLSWWGAWLDNDMSSNTTLTIAPDRWYNGVHTPNLLPTSWMRIPVARLDLLDAIAGSLLLKKRINPYAMPKQAQIADVVFFFNYARHTKNKKYYKIADSLLHAICENIHSMSPASFSNGIAGICWMVAYLISHGFVKGNINNLLSEVDAYLAGLIHRKEMQDLSFTSGLCGVGYYLVYRISILNEKSDRQSIAVRERLTHLIGELLDSLIERAENNSLEEQVSHDIFILLQDINMLYLYQDKVTFLYTYCMNCFDDLSHLLPNLNRKGLWR